MDEAQEAAERNAAAAGLKPEVETVRLLGRDIPVLAAADGTLRTEDSGKPASAKCVQSYLVRVLGDRLGEARAAMEALAASHPPQKERASKEEWRAQVGRKRIMACALGTDSSNSRVRAQ
jgi:hypothetical protein